MHVYFVTLVMLRVVTKRCGYVVFWFCSKLFAGQLFLTRIRSPPGFSLATILTRSNAIETVLKFNMFMLDVRHSQAVSEIMDSKIDYNYTYDLFYYPK